MNSKEKKKILKESDDEETAAGPSSSNMDMQDLSGGMPDSGSVANSGPPAGKVIITGRSDAPDITFGVNVASSDEEVVETPAEETKSRKRKDRGSGGVMERRSKASRIGMVPDEEGMVTLEGLRQGAVVVGGAVEKAEFALNTKFISYCMSKSEEFDKRLDKPARALDAIALWIQTHAKDASKWHWLKDKESRSKLKWSKVVDLYFGGDRNGSEGNAWFQKNFGDMPERTMPKEFNKMGDVIGRVFSKGVYRRYGFAYLIKLAEAMGQKQLDLLDASIWVEAEVVMRSDWKIWCQRISIREEYRGGFTHALSGIFAQDTGESYRKRYAGLTAFKNCVAKALSKVGSSEGTPSTRPKQKKRAITVEAVSSGVAMARASLGDALSLSTEVTSGPAPRTTSTGDVVFRVPGWTPYVPNDDDDIKWRKEAGELSFSELESALATVEAQGATGAKDRKDLQRMLVEKIDEVSILEAKVQVYRKVQETVKANKRVCKRVGNLFGEENAADAVNQMIKSFLDYYEGKVPDLREAAATVAAVYSRDVSQRLMSASDSMAVAIDSSSQQSQVASTSSASVLSHGLQLSAPIDGFQPGSASTLPKASRLLGDSQPLFSQGTGSEKSVEVDHSGGSEQQAFKKFANKKKQPEEVFAEPSLSENEDLITTDPENDDEDDADDEEFDDMDDIHSTVAGGSEDPPGNGNRNVKVTESAVIEDNSPETLDDETEEGQKDRKGKCEGNVGTVASDVGGVK